MSIQNCVDFRVQTLLRNRKGADTEYFARLRSGFLQESVKKYFHSFDRIFLHELVSKVVYSFVYTFSI